MKRLNPNEILVTLCVVRESEVVCLLFSDVATNCTHGDMSGDDTSHIK